MSLDKRAKFREDLLEWADENLREYTWREPDRSFYEVFIAEFFLTQTPADNVADAYPRFLRRFPDLSTIESASESEVADAIEPLGFHNMRASALTEIAEQCDELPEDPPALESLPRVGAYVANATLCFARSERVPILDRNVRRVYKRIFGDEFPGETENEWDFAEAMLPSCRERARTYNLALLDFGAMVCEKRDPQCEVCPANSYCDYFS